MARTSPRPLLLLLVALLLPFFASVPVRAQDGDSYGTYGGGGGGGNNTTAPTPATPPAQGPPNATRPTTPSGPPATPPGQQANATRPPSGVTPPIRPTAVPQGGGGADAAVASLPITLSNNNSWVNDNGTHFEQNNYLMQNAANRPICNVSLKAPLADEVNTRIWTSYNVNLRNTTGRELHFDLPFYLQKIWPGQVVSFGWILNGTFNGTATGAPVNVTRATFCDDNAGGQQQQQQFRMRRHVLARGSKWGGKA